jgi:hypothetical protein
MSVQFLAATTATASTVSDEDMKAILTGGIVFNVLLLIAIIYLSYRLIQLKMNGGNMPESAVRQCPRMRNQHNVGQVIEKQILNLAAVRGGILGVVETAYHTKLPLDIAETALESFVNRGFAEIQDRNGAQ